MELNRYGKYILYLVGWGGDVLDDCFVDLIGHSDDVCSYAGLVVEGHLLGHRGGRGRLAVRYHNRRFVRVRSVVVEVENLGTHQPQPVGRVGCAPGVVEVADGG